MCAYTFGFILMQSHKTLWQWEWVTQSYFDLSFDICSYKVDILQRCCFILLHTKAAWKQRGEIEGRVKEQGDNSTRLGTEKNAEK